MSPNTISDFLKRIREVCSQYLDKNPIKLGGPGLVVQIGIFKQERRIRLRKNDKMENRYEERLFFAAFCASSSEGFLAPIVDRKAETLLPLIEKHILPGTEIHSDQSPEFNLIGDCMVKLKYQHEIFKSAADFVCPVTGDAINHAEVLWLKMRRRIEEMVIGGSKDSAVQSYVDEFLWREKFGRSDFDAFYSILGEISKCTIFADH